MNFSFKHYVSFLLLSLLLWLPLGFIHAQCPTVLALMIDACGNESSNEFLIIDSGSSGFNTNDLFINFDANRNVNGPENNDVNTNFDNWPADQTPCGITFGNTGVYTGCSNVISIGPNFNVPPNVWVVFQISNGADEPYDFSSICGGGECIYVIANSCVRSAGGLSNATGVAPRSTEVGLLSGCSNIYTHDRTLLAQAEGAYWIPATDTYGINTCGAPPIGVAPPLVTFNNPGDMMVCNSYTLPAITGTGLSGNEAYFTSPGGAGLIYMAGQTITSTTTLYINDLTQTCVQEEFFTITITPPVTPLFSITNTYCAGATVAALPSISSNGINGSWSPAFIDNMNSGSYTFTPGPGQCANPTILNVTIMPAATPTFSLTNTFCQGTAVPALPGASDNGISGSWSPAVIDNMNSGSYTFTPAPGECADPFILNVTITPPTNPSFNLNTTYCSGEPTDLLPSSSDNGINGTWNPAVIDNQNAGSYTFTPNPGECASTFILNVNITPGTIPIFNLTDTYCAGDLTDPLSNTSDNGINGNWSAASINNMNSGSYTFTPNLGQCAGPFTLSVSITAPQDPIFSITTTYCAGGATDPLPGVSNNGISGSWSPAVIDNMNSGVYTFTPEAGSCANALVLNVTITSPVTTVFNLTNSYCTGDAVDPLPTISDNGISGNWSPAVINNTNSGSYTFSPNPGECANPFTLNVTITSGNTPIFSIPTTYCQGELAPPLPAVSDNGINGSWSPGTISNTSSGNYTFTPNPGQCAGPFTLSVTITPTVTPVFTLADTYCFGDPTDVLPSVSNNGVNGSWSPATISNSNSGSYTFTPNPGQCANAFTLNVIVNTFTDPTFFILDAYCQGDPVNALPNFSNEGISGSWAPAVINNMASDTYIFTPNPGQCANPFFLDVTISSGTTPTFNLTDTYCFGETVATLPTTSNNGINGNWTPGSINNMASGTYVFTPNPGQCAGTFTLNVTITPGTLPTFTINDTYCAGDVTDPLLILSDNGIIGNWSPGFIDDAASGTYTFTPNPGQCATSYSINITIIPNQPPSFILEDNYCEGETVDILPTVSNNGITGTWTPGVIDNMNAGTYTFTPNGNGCSSDFLLNVMITPAATPNFSLINTYCQGDAVDVLPTTSDNGITGTWTPAVINNMSSGAYHFTPNSGGCANGFTLNVTINLQPTATETMVSACEENNGMALFDLTQSNTVINGGSGLSVSWFSDNAGTSIINNPDAFTSSSITVYAQVNNGSCTSEIVPVEIVVHALPVLALTIASMIDCNGNTTGALDLEVNGQSPFQYDWSDNLLDGIEDPSGLAVGNYLVTVSDANNCAASTSMVLNEPSLLDLNCSAEMPPSGPGLSDGSGSFAIAGGTAPYSYQLTGPVNANDQNLAAGNYPLVNLSTGNYGLIITDANGCTSSCSFTIQDANCDLVLTLTRVNSTCNGANDGSITSTIVGGTPNFQYDWSNDSFDGQIDPSGLSPGLYSLTVTDDNGCMDSGSITISEPTPLVLDCHENGATEGNGTGSYSFFFSGATPPYQLDLSGPTNNSSTETMAGNWDSPVLSTGNYTFTLLDANHCQQSCTFTISCGLSLEITGVDPTCAGGNDGSIDLTILNNQAITSIDWSADNLDGTEDPQNLSTGTYSVTVTDEIGCTANISISLNDGVAFDLDCTVASEPSGPSASNGSMNIVVNNGPTGPYSISYDNSEGVNGSITGGLGDNMINNLPEGTYEMTISNGDCTATCSVTLTGQVCTFPLSETHHSPSCNGDMNGSITILPEGGNGSYTFDWSDDQYDGLNNLTDLLAGAYLVTVTDGLGCVSTLSIDLTEPSILTVDCSDTTDPASMGSNDGLLNLLVMGGTAPYLVSWSGPVSGMDNLLVAGMILINNLSAGAYEVMVVDANGCSSSCNFVLNDVDCDLSLDISGINPACAGEANGSIDLTISGSQNIISIDWNDDSLDGQEDPQALQSGTYSVTVNDEIGCIKTAMINLLDPSAIVLNCSVDQQPSATGMADGSLNVVINNGPMGVYTITYDNGVGNSGSINGNLGDNIISGLPEGTYQIEVTQGTCTEACQLTLIVDGCTMPVETTYTDTLCPGESVLVGGITFDESNTNDQVVLPGAASNGCDSIIQVSISFLSTAASMLDTVLCFNGSLELGGIVFNNANPVGTVILENAAASGCDSIIVVNTSYELAYTATLLGDTALCEGTATFIQLTTSGNFTYDYSIQPSSGALFTGNAETGNQLIEVSPSLSSTYLLSNITADNGCSVTVDNSEVQVSISNLSIQAEVSSDFNGFGVSCAEAEDGIAQVMASQGIAPYNYLWSNDSQSTEISSLAVGDYSVTVTDAIGCAQETNVSVEGPLPIIVEAAGVNGSCLENSSGQLLINNISGGGEGFEYSLDGTFFTAVSNFPQSISGLDPGNYTLIVQDDNDCSQSLDLIIDAGTSLTLDLGPDLEITLGDSILLDPLLNFLPQSWRWTPSTFLSQPDTFITYARPMESIVYKLEATDENGCTVSDLIRVIVSKKVDIFVPNTFSPNDDGVNDFLEIFAGKGVELIEQFQVFDRWGNQLYVEGPFQPNGTSYGWDGRRNGEEMNTGVYVYFAEVLLKSGETVIISGEVTLMR